ncbi:MAG: glycosyltransferase family 1 protein [Planctomycetota bacterium]|nr:glycosyltransferase family 1 protein [Planctomycetota bacterium]
MTLRPLIDLRAGLTQGEGVGRYSREVARALAARDDVEPRVFAPTWTRPSTTLAEAGLGGAPAFAPRLPSKPLTAALRALSIGVERLVRSGTTLVHNTQYRRLPSRLPAVTTVHDLAYLDSDRYVGAATAARMSRFARAAAARGDVLVTPSRAVAAEVVERLQVDPARVVAAPLGIDHVLRMHPADADRAAVAEEVRREGPFLLTAARIERRKNHLGLLRALERLGDVAPRWVLVGPDGEGAAEFHQALSSSPIRDRVQLLGRVSEGALRARLDACAAFALVPHDEGFGLAPLEAAALGRPVVTSAVPVVEEVCGGAAEFVCPDSPEEIARGIERVLGLAPRERDARAAAALRATWAGCAARHVEAFRLALAR